MCKKHKYASPIPVKICLLCEGEKEKEITSKRFLTKKINQFKKNKSIEEIEYNPIKETEFDWFPPAEEVHFADLIDPIFYS